MAFCRKCGTALKDDAKFCASCGEPAEAPKTDARNVINDLNNTADSTSDYSKTDIENNKFMAVLSYIWILVLVPIFAAKDSPFAKFHANQGLVLFICGVGYSIVVGIVRTMVTLILPLVGVILSTVFYIVSIVFLVLAILGIVNAVNGRAKELPIIGKIRILK